MAKSFDPFKIYNLGDSELQARTGLRASSIQDYNQIKAQYAGRGWVDPEFRHDSSSIGNLGRDTAAGTKPQDDGSMITFGPIEWIRAKDIIETKSVLLKKGDPSYPGDNTATFALSGSVSRFDISQGIIGNCYLLASLGCVATDPKILNFIVPLDNQNDNGSGVYHFRIWHMGAWVDIVIDDYLPYQGATRVGSQTTWYSPIGAGMVQTGKQMEFWVAMFEKAYAKLAGSYGAISEGAQCINVIQNLTGGFCERYQPERGIPHNLFEDLETNINNKKALAILTCAPSPKRVAEFKNLGLRVPHAYSITKVAKIYLNGQETKLVRIYNPHGQNEWRGPWSDNDPNWKLVDKKALEFAGPADDGEFWMTFEHMLQFFVYLDIASLVDFGAGKSTVKAAGAFELWETTYGTGNDTFIVNVGQSPGGGDSILLAEMLVKVAPWDRTKEESQFIMNVVPADGQQYWPLRKVEGTKCQLGSGGKSVCLGYKVQPGKYKIQAKIGESPTKDYVIRIIYTKA